ncbi:MAG: polyprenyl synthetase family protein [Thermoanaerobaculia bacterium]
MNHRMIEAARPAEIGRAESFLGLIEPKLVATEEIFRAHLASDVPFLNQAGAYIFAGGGKRMRPALLLLVSRLLGRDSDEECTYAAVVEYIHTATLIHDDIIDHAALRRGQRTPNELWGNSLTVLLGDWLYTKAMKMALAWDNQPVIDRLCGATLRMTEGELLTLSRLGAGDVSVDEYYEIIDRKTAQLFAAACSVPALMRPVRREAVEPLERYGRNLGLCFQIVDDLLDYTASERDLGKPVLSDLKEGKLTLPLLLLLPRIGRSERAMLEQVLADRSFERVEPARILELVAREGTLDEAAAAARSHAGAAKEALADLPNGDARSALEFAPDFVLHRRA